MQVIVAGGCGFVGAEVCRWIVEALPGVTVHAFDNLRRAGSETNRLALQRLGIRFVHGDVRCRSDVDALPRASWIVDAAAEPSVLAGTGAATAISGRQLVEHNLLGSINLLEYAARHHAGMVMLSTSRVYSIKDLAAIPLRAGKTTFELEHEKAFPAGLGRDGITEAFPTTAPISFYGATKLAAEVLATEYAELFGLPVVVDRCGVLSGPGQFGRADQGIFSWWIHSWQARRPLRYIGFGGRGLQVRDCLHVRDLARLIVRQITGSMKPGFHLINVRGGISSARSLAQVSEWCRQRFGSHIVHASDEHRPFDVPWVVLDGSQAKKAYGWEPETSTESIFEEIAGHADRHSDWLTLTGG